ncbi:ferredoxin [Halarsenatibacter silvermanii]|uniref:Ferredoxin n=1 Tax=Halarsenatibacter silvermanii TaxID=321763 RepID=A0A1G9KZ31_9FIRM|nr:ferredoxin [Halarsenatibacter silvermanii]SDL54909.1 Ferredoxin [Halarsenatibacter silvermanii]
MADKENKVPENVEGPFYVDEECIACEMCIDDAPRNFDLADEGHAYVKKQPESEVQKEACEEALMNCPVDAIGDDG